MQKAALYRGEVVHKRLRPVEHKLHYRVFSMLVDLEHLDEIAGQSRLFSLDRFNLFSLRQRDHGFRDQRSLSQFAFEIAAQSGVQDQVARTKMLFYPRIWGLAFNPLTVFFCENEAGNVVLAIYEVRNTFGEDLTYVLKAGEAHGGVYTHGIKKAFYVSPFNEVDGDYTFHITHPAEDLTVGVALKTQDGPLLRTHFKAKRSTFSDANLFKLFLSYPLMTLKIVGGIHWEALKLWRKGMKLTTKPDAPKLRLLFGDDNN